jgi:hypothetical protein
MKNTRLTSILGSSLIASALAIGSLVSTQVASAQSSTMAEVTIPFAFQVSTATLPAGTYRVVSESSNLIRVQGHGATGAFVITHDAMKATAPDHGSLVFDRYGDKYYLRQIWTAGERNGLECPKTRAEKDNQVAQNMQAPSTVELALNSIPKH